MMNGGFWSLVACVIVFYIARKMVVNEGEGNIGVHRGLGAFIPYFLAFVTCFLCVPWFVLSLLAWVTGE